MRSMSLNFHRNLAASVQYAGAQIQMGNDDFKLAEIALGSLAKAHGLQLWPASTDRADALEISSDENFIVLRTSGTTGRAKLNRHPLSFHENVVRLGIEAMEGLGITGTDRTCLIGIPVGRLSGGFIFCYEICRRKGWSVLPMGTNDDVTDVAKLISEFSVDTIIMLPNLINAVFVEKHAVDLASVRNILFLGEMLPDSLKNRMASLFPSIQIDALLYSSNDTGPIGCPIRGERANVYKIFDHVALEVSADCKDFAIEGTGELYVTILGRPDSHLVRWRIGDMGTLWTDSDGQRFVQLLGRSNRSVKFQMDRIGSSFIIERDQVLDWLRQASQRMLDETSMQFVIDARSDRTEIRFLLAEDQAWSSSDDIVLNLKKICPPQWNDRIHVKVVDRGQFARSASGKVLFFNILRSQE